MKAKGKSAKESILGIDLIKLKPRVQLVSGASSKCRRLTISQTCREQEQ